MHFPKWIYASMHYLRFINQLKHVFFYNLVQHQKMQNIWKLSICIELAAQ